MNGVNVFAHLSSMAKIIVFVPDDNVFIMHCYTATNLLLHTLETLIM